MVCAPGGEVGRVGNVDLIEKDDVELVRNYALTAKMYGFQYLYLEAGSGASYQVNPELIKAAKSVEGLTIIVGGGIKESSQAVLAKQGGADWIVTGTLTEEIEDYVKLESRLNEIISELN